MVLDYDMELLRVRDAEGKEYMRKIVKKRETEPSEGI